MLLAFFYFGSQWSLHLWSVRSRVQRVQVEESDAVNCKSANTCCRLTQWRWGTGDKRLFSIVQPGFLLQFVLSRFGTLLRSELNFAKQYQTLVLMGHYPACIRPTQPMQMARIIIGLLQGLLISSDQACRRKETETMLDRGSWGLVFDTFELKNTVPL